MLTPTCGWSAMWFKNSMLEGLILPLPLFFLCQFNYSSSVKIVKSMIVFIFLGVAQLLNKNNGKPFTEGDENLFEVSYSVHAVTLY